MKMKQPSKAKKKVDLGEIAYEAYYRNWLRVGNLLGSSFWVRWEQNITRSKTAWRAVARAVEKEVLARKKGTKGKP